MEGVSGTWGMGAFDPLGKGQACLNEATIRSPKVEVLTEGNPSKAHQASTEKALVTRIKGTAIGEVRLS